MPVKTERCWSNGQNWKMLVKVIKTERCKPNIQNWKIPVKWSKLKYASQIVKTERYKSNGQNIKMVSSLYYFKKFLTLPALLYCHKSQIRPKVDDCYQILVGDAQFSLSSLGSVQKHLRGLTDYELFSTLIIKFFLTGRSLLMTNQEKPIKSSFLLSPNLFLLYINDLPESILWSLVCEGYNSLKIWKTRTPLLIPAAQWGKDWLVKFSTITTYLVTFHHHWADTQLSLFMI